MKHQLQDRLAAAAASYVHDSVIRYIMILSSLFASVARDSMNECERVPYTWTHDQKVRALPAAAVGIHIWPYC